MRKAFAAFLTFFVAICGFVVVDKKYLENLEKEASSLAAQVSELQRTTTWATAHPTAPSTTTTTTTYWTNPTTTTTTIWTIPTTTTVTDADGYTVLPCPEYFFRWCGQNQVRITLTEYKYKAARVVEKNDDPQNELEATGGVIYNIKVKGYIPAEHAACIMFVYRTTDQTAAGIEVTFDETGAFALTYEHRAPMFEVAGLSEHHWL